MLLRLCGEVENVLEVGMEKILVASRKRRVIVPSARPAIIARTLS